MDEIVSKKRRPLGEYKGYIIRGEMPLETAKKPRKCSVSLVGQKFGKLLVIEEIGVLKVCNKAKHANSEEDFRKWVCQIYKHWIADDKTIA